MTAIEIMDAMGYIGDREIIELCSSIYKKKSTKLRHARRLFRILIAAAAIFSALGLTAYAVTSLHQRRQEELRRQYMVEENNVSSYVEYPEPEHRPGASLVSAISDGEFQNVFVNISPVTEDEIWQGINGMYFAYRLEADDSYSMATIMFDWSKLTEADIVYQLDEDTGAEIKYYDKQRIYELCLEDYYDPETMTLTLECSILKSRIEGQGPVSITLASFQDGMAEIREYGTVSFDPTHSQTRRIIFPEPLAFEAPELGEAVYVAGVEIYPTGMKVLLEIPDAEIYFGLHERTDEELITQTEWIKSMEEAVNTCKLLFSDGTEKAFPGTLSSPWEDGYLACYGTWGGTIDIDAVTAVEVMGQRMESD